MNDDRVVRVSVCQMRMSECGNLLLNFVVERERGMNNATALIRMLGFRMSSLKQKQNYHLVRDCGSGANGLRESLNECECGRCDLLARVLGEWEWANTYLVSIVEINVSVSL